MIKMTSLTTGTKGGGTLLSEEMRKNSLSARDFPVEGNVQSVLSERATSQHYLQAATSENTRRTYRSAIRQFERWGGRLPTEREALIRYLLAAAEQRNPRTLDIHITAISQWHQYQGFQDPTKDPNVRKVLEGIRCIHGKPKLKAKALSLQHIATMVEYLEAEPDNLKSCRDKALLLIAFFGAFRRSELVGIQVEDIAWEDEGILIQLRRSKTDQQGQGMVRAIAASGDLYCPVAALKNWLEMAGIVTGPLFRPINRWHQLENRPLRPAAINDFIKQLAESSGFNFAPELSSHSFRRGMSTAAARANVPFELIKKQGGWKSDTTVRGYIEEGRLLSDNASSSLLAELGSLRNVKE